MLVVRELTLTREFVCVVAGCGVVSGTVFTLVNRCSETVWPGLAGNGGTSLAGGGFALSTGQSVPVNAPTGWSGRFWGRTGCAFSASGVGSCATGNCVHGLKCAGSTGEPPATLAEFTIGGDAGKDFYDVSLVDGYNVPLSIRAAGGTGDCRTAGCSSDLRSSCPAELSVKGSDGRVIACRSACNAFGSAEYCCTGDHGNPQTCSPNKYSQIFKAACPTAYSYAYDDASSLVTCTHADYTITFCPSAAC